MYIRPRNQTTSRKQEGVPRMEGKSEKKRGENRKLRIGVAFKWVWWSGRVHNAEKQVHIPETGKDTFIKDRKEITEEIQEEGVVFE